MRNKDQVRTVARLRIMKALAEHGPVSDRRGHAKADLADIVGVTPTSLSNHLQSGTALGHFSVDSSGMRTYVIALTQKGERYLKKAARDARTELRRGHASEWAVFLLGEQEARAIVAGVIEAPEERLHRSRRRYEQEETTMDEENLTTEQKLNYIGRTTVDKVIELTNELAAANDRIHALEKQLREMQEQEASHKTTVPSDVQNYLDSI